MFNIFTNIADGFLSFIGRFVSFLVMLIMALIIFEMISRGFFSKSFPWTQEVSTWLLTTMVMIGGPYSLIKGNFVRVDVFFIRFGLKTRAIIDTFISSVFLSVFVFVLVKYGSSFFISSFMMGEKSATGSWSGPVWLPKLMIPLGGVMLALAWLLHLVYIWKIYYVSNNYIEKNQEA